MFPPADHWNQSDETFEADLWWLIISTNNKLIHWLPKNWGQFLDSLGIKLEMVWWINYLGENIMLSLCMEHRGRIVTGEISQTLLRAYPAQLSTGGLLSSALGS